MSVAQWMRVLDTVGNLAQLTGRFRRPAETEAGEAEGVVTARVAAERVPEALRALLAAGVDVFGVERPLASLEEVFLEITGGETV